VVGKESAVHRDLLDILVCPVTKEPLELVVEEEKDDEIVRGHLYSRSIDFHYPIEDGIPNLLPPDMQNADEPDSA
jgi:uncharacterized protein YbaR (Trm112 family)